MFTQRPLGEAGLAYIRERLDGGLTLAQHMLQVLPAEQGQAVTYLPTWVPDTYATDFEGAWAHLPHSGSAQGNPLRTFEDFLGQVVMTYVQQREHALAVWEDASWTRDAPILEQFPQRPLVYLDQEVYWVLSSENATSALVTSAVSSMVAWYGSPGVLATAPEETVTALTRYRTQMAREKLEALATHVDLIFFSAYDAEGYVLWALPSAQILLPGSFGSDE